jgi:hypothetical protein
MISGRDDEFDTALWLKCLSVPVDSCNCAGVSGKQDEFDFTYSDSIRMSIFEMTGSSDLSQTRWIGPVFAG